MGFTFLPQGISGFSPKGEMCTMSGIGQDIDLIPGIAISLELQALYILA